MKVWKFTYFSGSSVGLLPAWKSTLWLLKISFVGNKLTVPPVSQCLHELLIRGVLRLLGSLVDLGLPDRIESRVDQADQFCH